MLWAQLTKTATAAVCLVCLCLTPSLRAQQPEKGDLLQQAYMLWEQGYILHSFGEYESAAGKFRQSIEAYPTAEGHTYLG